MTDGRVPIQGCRSVGWGSQITQFSFDSDNLNYETDRLVTCHCSIPADRT